MKRLDIDQRIENSINAFFNNPEMGPGENQLAHGGSYSLSKLESESPAARTADTLVKVLKTVFIFLPGAFYLYFSSIFFLYALFVSKQSMLTFGFGLFLWLLSALMTMFGIGELRSRWSLLVPASICGVSLLVFLISLLLPDITQIGFLFEYSAYLFPLVLIAPYLTKTLIDRADNKPHE